MSAADVTRIDDVERFVEPILLAFSADPFVRWLLPEPWRFLTFFGRITRIHGEAVAPHGGAFGRGDTRGAAFWYPPGRHPDGALMGPVMEEAGMIDKVKSVFEMCAPHEPAEPHWYLRQIGVDPVLQRSGHGSALIQSGLDEADRERRPAYLEATSAAGVAFYERHGFEVLAEVSVAGAPPLWPMLRSGG